MKIHGGKYLTSADLRALGAKRVGNDVLVHEETNLVGLENIELGDHVRIDPYVIMIANAGGWIRLGSFIHVGAHCYLAGRGGIEMEDFSGLSQGVRVYSVTDDYSGLHLTNPSVPAEYLGLEVGTVRLERHVIVGAGSVILPGVVLKEGAAVGALSLVTKDLEPWGVYFGIPARRLKGRSRGLLELERTLMHRLELSGNPQGANGGTVER